MTKHGWLLSPLHLDNDQIRALIEKYTLYSQNSKIIKYAKSTIYEHFMKFGFKNRFGSWVTEKDQIDRIFICDSVFESNEKI